MQPANFPIGKRTRLHTYTCALIAALVFSIGSLPAADGAAYEAAIASGKNKLDAGDAAAAMLDFQRAVQADGAQSEGFFYLAVATFRLGDQAAALEYANAAVAAAGEKDKRRAVQLVQAIRKAKDTDDLARQADEAQDNGLNAKAADLYARAFQLSSERGDLALKAATLYATRLNRLLDAAVLFQGAIASGDAAAAQAAGAELGALHSKLQQLYHDELPRAIARADLTALVQLSQAFPIEVQPRIEIAALHAAKGDGQATAMWLGQGVKLGASFDALKERPAFADLWAKDDAAFKTFIADAFGATAVTEMGRRAKAHQARQLEEHYKIKINTVKKHLLSGAFHLDMGAAAFRSLYRSRLSGFKTESPPIRHFQKQLPGTLDDWIEFPTGLVVSATAHGTERKLLDHQKILDWESLENPPLFEEKTDGPALRAFVDHVSATGLKPFLGLNENWKLVAASLHRDDVHILSFATTLNISGSHADVLKRLIDVFGSLQPFNGAPKGFFEYTPDDSIIGCRFLFPQANGITFDGRIFRTKENLVQAPWILELRVSRMDVGTALFHQHYSVDAPKNSHATFSKRFAEQSVRETLQTVAGLKATVAGRDCVLEKNSAAFHLYDTREGARATLIVKARETQTGDVFLATYHDLPLASVDDVVTHRASDPAQAWRHDIHLTEPGKLTITRLADGEEETISDEATHIVSFYSRNSGLSHEEAIVAALPSPHKLTDKNDANRIARVFGYGGVLDSPLYHFFNEAEARGKFDDLFFLAKLAPHAAKPELFKRAAKAGNVRAMAELRMLYKEKWFARDGTPKDREQLFHWGARAADAGDLDSLRFMIDEAQHIDLLATERWMKQLQAVGDWHRRYDAELESQITRRANLLRTLTPLPFDAKVRAHAPLLDPSSSGEIEGSAIGKKFKTYATAEKQFTLTQKSAGDRTSKNVKVYQRHQPVLGGPQQVWVNRKGIVVGEYYLLAQGASAKSSYEEQHAYLVHYFGAENLAPVPGTNLRAGVSVKTNLKTIELLHFEKRTYLKYIDHTLE